MQPVAHPPREAYVENEGAVHNAILGRPDIAFGCELLRPDGGIEDISEVLLTDGVEVERNNFATVHGSCRLRFVRTFNWGPARFRPYMTLDGIRFNLGAYVPATPVRAARGTTVSPLEISCDDKLALLRSPLARTWRVPEGTGHLWAARSVLHTLGEFDVVAIGISDDKPANKDLSWPIDAENTPLRIINDLLDPMNYRGLWEDWDGAFRLEPYPADAGPEWTYSIDDPRSIVTAEPRTVEEDTLAAYNRWAFVLDDPEIEPTEDNGRLILDDNENDGPTSQSATGRLNSRIERLTAADVDTFAAKAARMIADDKQVPRYMDLTVGPNPLHWHFDRVEIADPTLNAQGFWQVSSWKLNRSATSLRLRAL